jgi:hypothetical protein
MCGLCDLAADLSEKCYKPVLRACENGDVCAIGHQGSRQEEVNRPVQCGCSERPGEAVVPGAGALRRLAQTAACMRQRSQLACAGRQAGTDMGPRFPVAWLNAASSLSMTVSGCQGALGLGV